MKKKCLSMLIAAIAVGFAFIYSTAKADENMLKMYDGLDDSQYVLLFPDGGFIRNNDGSPNFSQEQIEQVEGEVLTVAEAKQKVAELPVTSDFSDYHGTSFFSYPRLNPPRSYVLANGQSATEYVAGSGWRYSKHFYHPQSGTGAYLLWQTFVDSGRAGTTPIYPGSPKYIMSDVGRGTYTWGLQYSTYNAPAGTHFTVSNR